MMTGMNSWEGKDDLDLTSDDIDAMLRAGETVVTVGPRIPGGGVLAVPAQTGGSDFVLMPTPGFGRIQVSDGQFATA